MISDMTPGIGTFGTSSHAETVKAAPARPFPSFCVVIPMHNEERGAELCVREVCSALAEIPYRCALIVVNDGSRDATHTILDRLASDFPRLNVIHLATNGGYGHALQAGVA